MRSTIYPSSVRHESEKEINEQDILQQAVVPELRALCVTPSLSNKTDAKATRCFNGRIIDDMVSSFGRVSRVNSCI